MALASVWGCHIVKCFEIFLFSSRRIQNHLEGRSYPVCVKKVYLSSLMTEEKMLCNM
jgi:hypothetical protein